MSVIRAFALFRYCISSGYRAQAHARWRKTLTDQVILGIGGDVTGLIIMVAIIFLIVVNSR